MKACVRLPPVENGGHSVYGMIAASTKVRPRTRSDRCGEWAGFVVSVFYRSMFVCVVLAWPERRAT
jgi:hypothetical protein